MNSKNEVLIWKTCVREARKLFSHSVTAAPLDLIPPGLGESLNSQSITVCLSHWFLLYYRSRKICDIIRISWVKRPFSPACGKPHVAWQWRSKEKRAERSRKSKKKKKKRKSIPKSPKSVTTKRWVQDLLQSSSILLSSNYDCNAVALNNLSL